MGGDKPAGGGGDRGSWVYGATAAMSSVSPNFLLWSRTRLQPQAPAAVEGGLGAAFTAGADARLGEAGDASRVARALGLWFQGPSWLLPCRWKLPARPSVPPR